MTLFDNRDWYQNIDWNNIYNDYQTGLSTRQLSIKYKISRPTIHRYFTQFGFKADHKPNYLTEENNHNWKGGLHFCRNRAYLRIEGKYIHRANVVWEFYEYKVPEGFDLHHINEDSLDDDIFNLEILSHSEHAKHHMKKSKVFLKSPTGLKFMEAIKNGNLNN